MNTQPSKFTPKQAAGLANLVVREGFNRELYERVKQARSIGLLTAEKAKERNR